MGSDQGQKREALRKMREVLQEFLQGHVGAATFVQKYRPLFSPFDPPDLSMDELSEGEKAELNVFIRVMGGWFGEEDDVIPKRSDWKYGQDTEPFSWIDGAAYRTVIREALTGAGIRLPE